MTLICNIVHFYITILLDIIYVRQVNEEKNPSSMIFTMSLMHCISFLSFLVLFF